MGFYYEGLQYFGTFTTTYQVPLNNPIFAANQTYQTLTYERDTSFLVNFVQFRFRFKAVDRNGSGISGGTITQLIRFE